MTPTLSYRLATDMMTAFVVMTLWSQTLVMPSPAEPVGLVDAARINAAQVVLPELA